jgi:nucleoside 2-deoxyribosyltransferase
MQRISGLIAYPSEPSEIGHTILSALDQVRHSDPSVDLSSWEENDIAGRFIIEPVLSRIDEGNILIADVTRLNFNVVFEIGYTIGRHKRVFLTRNLAMKGSEDL